mgnify:CR=1 FL=1
MCPDSRKWKEFQFIDQGWGSKSDWGGDIARDQSWSTRREQAESAGEYQIWGVRGLKVYRAPIAYRPEKIWHSSMGACKPKWP